jgi:hypothetical protein
MLLLLCGTAYGQSNLYLRADSIRLLREGGNGELILMNGTRATTGVLVNYGNGRTRFYKPRFSGDTLFIGVDTLIVPGGSTAWKLTGNTALNDSYNFLGTTDDEALRFKTNGVNSGLVGNRGSTFFGYGTGTGIDSTGNHDSTGYRNTAFGYMAGANYSGSGASVFMGFEANKTGRGSSDIFIGFRAGKYAGASSFRNTLISLNGGYFVNGNRNTGVGVFNWESLRAGSNNTGIGEGAGRYATDANGNTALGSSTNHNNTTWVDTIIVTAAGSGYTSDPTVVISTPCEISFGWPFAVVQATATAIRTGDAVTSVVVTNHGDRYSSECSPTVSFTGGGGSGATAYIVLKSGHYNTAVGYYALFANSTGNQNTAVGYHAGYGGTAGNDANTRVDSLMTFIGANAVRSSTILNTTKLTASTAIGANATVATSNSLVLGAINGVNGATSNTFVGIGTASPAARLHVNARIRADSGFLSAGTTGVALNAALSNTNGSPYAVFARNASAGSVATSGMRLVSDDNVATGDLLWQNTINTTYIAQGNGLLLQSTGIGGVKTIVPSTRSVKIGYGFPAANSNTMEFYLDSVVAKNIESNSAVGDYNSVAVFDSTNGRLKYVAKGYFSGGSGLTTLTVGSGGTTITSGTAGRMLLQSQGGGLLWQVANLSYDSATLLTKIGGTFGAPLGFATNDIGLSVTRGQEWWNAGGSLKAYLSTEGFSNETVFRMRNASVTDAIQFHTGAPSFIENKLGVGATTTADSTVLITGGLRINNGAAFPGAVWTASNADGRATWIAAPTSGTYTPTVSNTSNVDATTAFVWQYMRVGTTVTVSGKIEVDATAVTNTTFQFTLPFASAFTTDGQAAGGGGETYGRSAVITSNVANDLGQFFVLPQDAANRTYYISFTYQIL